MSGVFSLSQCFVIAHSYKIFIVDDDSYASFAAESAAANSIK